MNAIRVFFIVFLFIAVVCGHEESNSSAQKRLRKNTPLDSSNRELIGTNVLPFEKTPFEGNGKLIEEKGNQDANREDSRNLHSRKHHSRRHRGRNWHHGRSKCHVGRRGHRHHHRRCRNRWPYHHRYYGYNRHDGNYGGNNGRNSWNGNYW
eukprot:189782_1